MRDGGGKDSSGHEMMIQRVSEERAGVCRIGFIYD